MNESHPGFKCGKAPCPIAGSRLTTFCVHYIGDVNVKVAEEEVEEVDFKEITQTKALELLKVGLA